jgi:hypothetical protein
MKVFFNLIHYLKLDRCIQNLNNTADCRLCSVVSQVLTAEITFQGRKHGSLILVLLADCNSCRCHPVPAATHVSRSSFTVRPFEIS